MGLGVHSGLCSNNVASNIEADACVWELCPELMSSEVDSDSPGRVSWKSRDTQRLSFVCWRHLRCGLPCLGKRRHLLGAGLMFSHLAVMDTLDCTLAVIFAVPA